MEQLKSFICRTYNVVIFVRKVKCHYHCCKKGNLEKVGVLRGNNFENHMKILFSLTLSTSSQSASLHFESILCFSSSNYICIHFSSSSMYLDSLSFFPLILSSLVTAFSLLKVVLTLLLLTNTDTT